MESGMMTGGFEREASLQQDLQALTMSRRLARSVSQKLRKKSHGDDREESNEKKVQSRCLGLYNRGGGCKVGADTSEDFGNAACRRRSNAGEEGSGCKATCGAEEVRVDCFSYGMTEMFWKRNSRKVKELEEPPRIDIDIINPSLPDDLLEMCLVRLPLTTLMTARLVCKKWRYLTSTHRFMQMRHNGQHQSPWLFLFGVVRDVYWSGQIHALDVSVDQWHRINADILRGRFLFSVASMGSDLYVVGGCSSLSNFGKVDRSSFVIHNEALVFSPETRSWRKVAPMKYARSTPIIGVFETGPDCSIFQNQQVRRFPKSRVGCVSDVYEDPHRLSLRRALIDTSDESGSSFVSQRQYKFVKQENNLSNTEESGKFLLIVVGGMGAWDEPLESGEIYDPVSNKWTEIQRLPGELGVICSGVVCNGRFYAYSETNKLAAYDLGRGIWVGIHTASPPPHLNEYKPRLICCNNRLFILCVSWCEGDGQRSSADKAIRKLWELDLAFFTWTEVSVHPDAPLDPNAVFVADRNQIFGVEMFKIFGQVLDFLTMCDVSDSNPKWSHISKKHVAHELGPSSCVTKSLAVLHL